MTDVLEGTQERAGLSAAKQALLQRRLAAARGPSTVAIPRRDEEGPAPLSFAQERLWFLDRLDPGRAVYNVFSGVRLHGPLDPAALEDALAALVRRHESLRTAVAERGGAPVQQVNPAEEWACEHADLSALAAEEREAEVTARARALAEHPFDLARGPLFRAVLLRLGGEEHALLLCMHHLASDGWSMGILWRELAALYAAALRGEAAELPEPAVRYGDYAAWQRERLRGPALEREVAFWRERLAGAPELLDLPADHPRPPVQSFAGRREAVAVPAALAERLRALARAEGSTLFMVLLAAWQALLGHYAGQDDVVVGTPVAGRTEKELEEVVGLFANTLALRTDLSGDPPFRALLHRVRETMLGAYDHQELPFEKLVEALQPERSLGHSPLFQSLFTLQDAGSAPAPLEGVRVTGLALESRIAKFDLSLAVAETADGLRGGVLYAAELFEPATVRRLVEHWTALLAAAAEAPERPLGELLWTSLPGREALLARGAGPDAPPAPACLHHAFQAHARRAPDALAVACEGERMTYGELDRRANRVAHALRARGVGPEVRVGLMVERSARMPAALLGILKAGGAYVPLDPEYPAERLAYMLRDSGAALLLTTEPLRAAAGACPVPVLSLDGDAAEIEAQPDTDPAAPVGAENLAYVMYTSGSTGRPKGVMIQHGGVAARLAASVDLFGVEAGSRVVQAGSLSFDVSVLELFLALSGGASLHVAPRDTVLSAERFGALLRRERITTWAAVPALLEVLDADAFPELRTLSTGGDRCPPEVAARWAAAHRLLNVYAPTEATIYATAHPCRAVVEPPPVGAPIAGARAFVLDGRLRPVPPGAAGELYVGGAGVARGYLGRPALTAERFVPDPFSSVPGARLYRSGDRARWNAEGELEFLGRVDQQVKIRGIRVEPGEVEAALRRHPEVREAVVAARAGEGGMRLVAWVVLDRPLAPAELGGWLAGRLPRHLVPAAFVVLDALPLLPTGKVDRLALPEPDPGAAGEAYAPPSTPAEEILCGIWAEVLGIGRVGVHDDFFALGGHSLQVTGVLARLRAALGVELPVRALFEAPTVARLAARAEAARGAGGAAEDPPRPRPEGAQAPLSFAQERLWFLDRLEPGTTAYNVPAALRLRGPLDVAALDRALEELVRRHEALRTVFLEVDGRPVQVVDEPGRWRVERADLSAAPDREAALRERVRAHAERPFDLACGPLFRAERVRMGDDDHALLLCVHHAVADGWSMGLLFRELAALYAAFRRGEESPLAPLPVQFGDFALWQRERLRGERLEGELAYWRAALEGAPELLELPTDRARPPVQGGRAGAERLELSAELAERLRALARREGCTLHMVLLAAWQALLGRSAGQERVVVGGPIAGRTHRELEGAVGFFANTLALHADLSGDPTVRELLARVLGATLGAYEHHELPFEKLVDALGVQRTLAWNPLFQTAFVLLHAGEGDFQLDGVRSEPIPGAELPPKFDLLLSFTETEGGLAGGVQYRAELFDPRSVRGLADRLALLLEEMAADPERRLSRLRWMGEAERRRVLVEWNDTARPFPLQSVHALVREQAARAPGAVALEFGARTLGYAELDAASERVAHALRAAGAGRGTRVAVLLERSAELVVAVLGALKAGAAYVPLDPAYPAERLALMLADAAPAALVTSRALAPPAVDVPVLRVEEMEGGSAAAPLPDAGAGPEDPAYLCYTSGSTGTPKGVVVPHRGVVRLVRDPEYAPIRPGDRVAQACSQSFDVFTWEVWGALANGATLVGVERETTMDPARLAAFLREKRVDALFLTPAIFNEAVRHVPGAFAGVRDLILGGEALDPEMLRRCLADRPPARLLNGYGPTENTTYSTWYRIDRLAPDAPTVPIGWPLGNSTAYVLDGRMEPALPGSVGELYVGGAGLAHGYWARPALTAERFVPDPFGAPGGRLYRTGDRSRWNAAGELEFLGRMDHQVKIRGVRVEPAEVEVALREHPAVSDAVVVPRGEGAGGTRLVAYVAAAGAEGADLRAFLGERLPAFLVPAAVVVMERLPLTPNGKVDRRALPDPEAPAAGGGEDADPRTPTEETLCAVWAEVLGVERVGIHDNFFELGGDSILSIQVVARARARGVRLTPRQLFDAQTVAALADVAGSAAEAGAEQGEVHGEAPLTPIQRWFLEGGPVDPHHFTQSMLLRPRAPLDPAAAERAVEAVVRHHDALRLRFVRGEDGWRQHHAPAAGSAAFAHVDLADRPDGEREAALSAHAADMQASLDLAEGPLLRAVLYELGAEHGQRLLVVVHHLAVDSVSWRILLEDLESAYGQAAAGQAVRLAPKTTSFGAWARRLAEHARAPEAAAELPYWLAGPPEGSPLPVDLPGGGNLEGEARTLTVSLGEPETGALLREVPQAYRAGIEAVLLSALARVLARWSGGRALHLHLEGHGREELFEGVDLSRTVGWFTALYPVHLAIDPWGDPVGGLRAVKEQLARVPRRGVGFGVLRWLAPDEAAAPLRALPAPEVSFNYLGQFDASFSAGGLLAPAGEERGPSRSPRAPRAHLLDVVAVVSGGRLHVTWVYGAGVHREETVRRLADEHLEALRALAASCGTAAAPAWTAPAALAEAGLAQHEMDDILAELSE